MKITISYAALIDGAPDARTVQDNCIAMAQRLPVVILTAADFERIVAALRPFAQMREWTQSLENTTMPVLGADDFRAAAEIVKEIEG